MKDWQIMVKKTNSLLSRAYWFFRFKMPAYITLVSLYGLALLLLSKGETGPIFTSLFVVIGITIATSQTCFAYLDSTRDKKTKAVIKNAGEHFLAASMWMSIAALIAFLSTQYDALVNNEVWYLKIPSPMLHALALLHFTYSADSINKGLHRIGYVLFWKLDI